MNIKPDIKENFTHRVFDKIDSTSEEAKRIINSGNISDGITLISAEKQTKGRGRLERKWISGEGNLFASLVIKPDTELETALNLSFISALAARDAIKEVTKDSAKIEIKWPNDIMLNGKKLGGILLDTDNRKPLYVIVGFGLNVASSPKKAELSNESSLLSYEATDLKKEGFNAEVTDLLKAFTENFSKWISIWDKGSGFDKVLESMEDSLFIKKGDDVKINGKLEGKFDRLDKDGAMIVKTKSGMEMRVDAGDAKKVNRPIETDKDITIG